MKSSWVLHLSVGVILLLGQVGCGQTADKIEAENGVAHSSSEAGESTTGTGEQAPTEESSTDPTNSNPSVPEGEAPTPTEPPKSEPTPVPPTDPAVENPEAVGCGESAERIQMAMLILINEQRSLGGVCGGKNMGPSTGVANNDILDRAAMNHSMDMAINAFFSHTGSDGSNPGQRASSEGWSNGYMRENIAGGYKTVGQVFNAWMKSSGHCTNILHSDNEFMGVACASSNQTNNTPYWTLMFGRN